MSFTGMRRTELPTAARIQRSGCAAGAGVGTAAGCKRSARCSSKAAFFWGLWLLPLALMLWRLGGVRKLVAALVATAGVGYVVGATTALALPQFEPQLRGWLQLMIMGEMAVIVWFVGFSWRRRP